MAVAAGLLVAACAGESQRLACPQVSTVFGLDRLELTYPGAAEPIPTFLDVSQVICERDGDEIVVANAVAIRLAGPTPPGGAEVRYSIFVESAGGMSPNSNQVALIAPGSRGAVEYFDHRLPATVVDGGQPARILYALVPDAAEYERLRSEVPRP